MQAPTVRLGTSVVSPSVVFLIFATVLVILFVSFIPELIPPKGGPELHKLPDAARQSIAITLEMNKFAITLATLIFGAVGTLVVGKDNLKELTKPQIALALLTLLASSAALYFSYIVYDRLVVMLSHNFLKLSDKAITLPRTLQINALGVAVVMLAALFLSIFSQHAPPKEESHAA
jgi:hypothetical protein